MRPATRIGRWVIFTGGYSGRLKLWPYLLMVFGLKSDVILARDLVGGGVVNGEYT